MSMLNWRRDPDYDRRMNALAHEIVQLRHESEQIESEIKPIEKETEQLRQENPRLKALNASGRELLASIDALCFQPEFSSTPATIAAADSPPILP
ncbi:MAG: hypothetical protein ACK55X_14610 [Synechococcaceae cyanobacterium]